MDEFRNPLNNQPEHEQPEAPSGAQQTGPYTEAQPREVWERWQPQAPVYPQTDPAYRRSEPVQPQQPAEGAGKRRKKTPWAVIVALVAVVCIAFGGVAGGLISALVLQNDDTPVVEAPATQPEALEQDPQAEQAPEGVLPGFSLEDVTKPLGDRETLTVAEINVAVSPSVVTINTVIQGSYFGQPVQSTSGGSGVIISNDGYIMTNNHVVEGAMKISVVLSDGTEYEAMLVGTDAETDLAVIKVEAENLVAATLGDSDELVVGELAVVIGNPLGNLPGSVSMGIISGKGREITIDDVTLEMIQVDAAINPGNSGGALVNAYGEVVGINTAKTASSDVEGLGYAIPINNAKPIIEELINNGYVTGRPFIGVSTRDVTEEIAAYYKWPEGVYITSVTPFSAAEKAGLQRGDIITAVDGETGITGARLSELRDSHAVGDELVLTVYREGETLTLTLVMGEQIPGDVG